MSENEALSRASGPKKRRVAGDWANPCNEKLLPKYRGVPLISVAQKLTRSLHEARDPASRSRRFTILPAGYDSGRADEPNAKCGGKESAKNLSRVHH